MTSTSGTRDRPARGGSRPALERDPEKRCQALKTDSDERCGNYKRVGLDVCGFHGAGTPAAKDVALVAKSMKTIGLEPVKPAEFVDHLGRLLAEYTGDRAALREELDALRLTTTSEVDLVRDYADVLDRMDRQAAIVSGLMTTYSKLSIAGTYEKDVDLTRTGQWTCLVTAMSSVLDNHPAIALEVAEAMAAAEC